MTHRDQIIARSGLGAALLGTAAGFTEVVVGTAPWLGNKNEPTTLGLVTVLLAFVIGAAGWAWRWATTTPRALAVAAAMLAPALLGVTTAGAAWLPAGAAAVLGGIAALRYGVQPHLVRPALSERWPSILLGCLALIYLTLGITAGGLTGVLAIAGSIAIGAALSLRHRFRATAASVLIVGALPFGVVAWWSIAPPLSAVLVLVVGLPLVLAGGRHLHAVNDPRNDIASPSRSA